MELQWPLIIFTTGLAWAAGLFGFQSFAAIKGEGKKSQMIALIASVVILAVSGVAVLFHLASPLRIFNGFGNPTSGITQELAAIVVLFIFMVIYFVQIRKSDDGGTPSKWCAICAIIFGVVLLIACGHSYMMASRPAWNSVLEIGSLWAAALLAGPLTFAFIMSIKGDDVAPVAKSMLIAGIVGLVLLVAYGIFISACGDSFNNVGNYFDPINPNNGMVDTSSVVAGQLALLWVGGVVLGGVCPVICAAIAWKKPELARTLAVIGAICAIAGAVCMRVAFYNVGLTFYSIY